MVMVFTLVSHALEWLTTHKEGLARSAKEEKERRKKELEEAERVSSKEMLLDFVCSGLSYAVLYCSNMIFFVTLHSF